MAALLRRRSLRVAPIGLTSVLRLSRGLAARKLVGSLDQGTTSTRFILFDEHARAVVSHQMEHKQFYPRDGWCEHDPLEIVDNAVDCIDSAVGKLTAAGYSPSDVVSIGITNQRETTVVWDKYTGQPLHNAVVWLDLRTTELAKELAKEGGQDRFRHVTGLPISTYFSAVKLLWLMRNDPAVAGAIREGRAMFGTIDTWLLWKMSGGHSAGGVHATDVTNASRTMLMDLKSCEWHEQTCKELGIPPEILPEIRSCSEVFGHLASTSIRGVPITGILGDQHAAMLGQLALDRGEAKCTYGTGCFLLLNVGNTVVESTHGLLSTVCFKLGKDAPTTYALEGGVAIAGRAINWLRDNLGIISSAKELETLAREVDSCEGVVFVPAFSGLFAPYWRSDARAVIVGMTLYTTRQHIARAALESVALQARELLDAMSADASTQLPALKVDGGMSVNKLLLQMQADAVQVPVIVPREIETTAMGAAFASGLASGVWRDTQQLRGLNPPARQVVPRASAEECAMKLERWKDAVQRSLGLAT
mmetsp:Transcript_26375/g.80054  ORF Transcript_26375/g.80054 Transcript_26375/m.80054 type:complete len:533 (-) Transcript_26375:305-1903(-)